MPLPTEAITIDEFESRVREFSWVRPKIRVQVHHTYRPSRMDWQALVQQVGPEKAAIKLGQQMHGFHTKTRGWSDIGQHISIMPDGLIVPGRDWNRTPAGCIGFNRGSFMFEAVGDLRNGKEFPPPDDQWQAMVRVIASIHDRFDRPTDDKTVFFHKEGMATECPGDISKPKLIADVGAWRDRDDDAIETPAEDALDQIGNWWDGFMKEFR